MKTIRFDRSEFSLIDYYSLDDEGVDKSGEYVRAEVARGMYDALEKIACGMGMDLLGTTSLAREDMQEIARKALENANNPPNRPKRSNLLEANRRRIARRPTPGTSVQRGEGRPERLGPGKPSR